jgi:hypothetical protein
LDRTKPKTCESETDRYKKPGIKPGFLNGHSESVTLVTLRQVAANTAAQRTAQTSTDGGTGLAAQAVADHRTTGGTDATADCCFGAAAFARGYSTAGCARNASTNRSARAAAHALADHITQRATQTAAQRGRAVASSHCTLSNQKPQNQGGQC